MNRIKKSKKDKKVKVVRVTRTEFELDNGDVYPLPFELDHTPTLKEFNKIYANSRHLVEQLVEQAKNKAFDDPSDSEEG